MSYYTYVYIIYIIIYIIHIIIYIYYYIILYYYIFIYIIIEWQVTQVMTDERLATHVHYCCIAAFTVYTHLYMQSMYISTAAGRLQLTERYT